MTRSKKNLRSLQSLSPLGEKDSLDMAVDECSTSAQRKFGGYMLTLLLASRSESGNGCESMTSTKEQIPSGSGADPHIAHSDANHSSQSSLDASAITNCSVSVISKTVDDGVFPADRTHQHHLRKCKFKGCSKGARGASGLYIAHGVGQRCQKPGCNKGAESRSVHCKAYGGGRRCQQLGCTKGAEGKTVFCIAHGGGHRCGYPGCTKAARGRSGLFIRHGGGKRCTVEGCTRSARAKQACAFRMVEDAGASSQVAIREHKGAPCTVRHMVEEEGAFLKAAPKGLKAAHHCVRVTVEGSAASMKGVMFAQRVSMAPLTTVLHMEEGNDVLCLVALRVPMAELIFV